MYVSMCTLAADSRGAVCEWNMLFRDVGSLLPSLPDDGINIIGSHVGHTILSYIVKFFP